MAQKSYPWRGVAPANGADAGRYTAKQWWSAWAAQNRGGGIVVESPVTPLRTDTALANLGVIYAIPNRLEVTDAGGFVAEVDTGGALVEGQFYYNDATVSLTIPANQTYYIVLRKNYTAATYTPPGYVAGDGLVTQYTTRITWVSALVQSTDRTTYWDIPLATVVTDGVEITSVTDTREYVDAETKKKWIPALMGYNATDGTEIPLSKATGTPGYATIMLPNGKDSRAMGMLAMPEDFISSAVVTFVCHTDALSTGTVALTNLVQYGECGQIYSSHSDTYSDTPNVGASRIECPIETILTVVGVDDFIFCSTTYGDNSSPGSYNDDLFALGWYLEYLGWR